MGPAACRGGTFLLSISYIGCVKHFIEKIGDSMKKIFILLFVVLVVFGPVSAEKKASFQELMRPDALMVDNEQLYIVDGIHIYIYSLKDFKLKEKVGKEGAGPREFQKSPLPYLASLIVHRHPDHLVVNSMGRVTLLSKTGEFIKETKVNFPFARFTPLGEKYGVMGMTRDDKARYITINLYDGTFQKEKELFRFPFPAPMGKKRDPIPLVSLNKNLIYFASGDILFVPTLEGVINAFNSKGEKAFVIQHPFPKVKVSDDLEKQLDKLFSQDFRFKRPYEADKARNLIEFGEYLPIIKAYRAVDKKLYVVTNNCKKGTNHYETYVFDAVNGSFLKKVNLPLQHLNVLEEFPFDIHDGKIYQVVENEDEEEWELHVTSF
jgi:hypothetical protein